MESSDTLFPMGNIPYLMEIYAGKFFFIYMIILLQKRISTI